MTVLAAVCVAVAVLLGWQPGPERRLRRVFAAESPRRELDRGLMAAGAVVLLGTAVAGWPWGTLIGGALAPLVRERVTTGAGRGTPDIGAEVPLALDLVAAALAAGRSPSVAVGAAAAAIRGPTGRRLEEMSAQLATALDPAHMWRGAPERTAFAPLARAIARAERSGAAPAAIIEQAADDLRRQRQAAMSRRSRSGGVVTAAPLGLCFLPAFFLVGVVPTLLGLVGNVFG